MTILDFIFLQEAALKESNIKDPSFGDYIKTKLVLFADSIVDYLPRVVGAIIILIIGFWIVKRLVRVLLKKLDNSTLNDELKPFVKGTVNISLKVLVILIAAGVVGVETSSFAALLAAVGFSLGLAFQGSLGHLASGVLIFIFRPFKVGDYVEIQNKLGIVTEIELLNTHIKTFDNKDVIIPNGMAISDVLTNFSHHDYVRVEIKVPIGYWVDFPTVKKIIEDTLEQTEHVLKEPKPFAGINTFTDYHILLDVFVHCKVQHYREVHYLMHQNIKKALHENNIKVTYHEGIEVGEIGG